MKVLRTCYCYSIIVRAVIYTSLLPGKNSRKYALERTYEREKLEPLSIYNTGIYDTIRRILWICRWFS